MPAGVLDTVPEPVPALLAVSVNVFRVNNALTEFAEVIVITQVPVPLQPLPLQPLKVDPVEAAADSVTTVPWSYGSVQSPPQLIPAGVLDTVPAPEPVLLTVNV